VHFAATVAGIGPGPCPAALGGHCLDLLSPQLLGSAVADATGVATFVVPLPAALTLGTTVHTQAVAVRGIGGSQSVLSPPLSATLVAEWDGTHLGTMTAHVDVPLLPPDACTGDMVIEVDSTSVPPITGEVRQLVCPLLMQTGSVTLTGDLLGDLADGELEITVPALGVEAGTWEASLAGDELDGLAQGSFGAVFDYDATFLLTR
jgi:hypothetical protein